MLNKARLGVRVTTCSEAAGGGEGVGGRGVGRPEWEAFVPNDLRANFRNATARAACIGPTVQL